MRLFTPRTTSGSSTFLALFMLALLGLIGATILLNASHLYNGNEKDQGWQEALFAAEAGADVGLANVRWTVVPGSPTAFDSTKGWAVATSGNTTTYSFTTPTISQSGGEGTTQTWAVVTVDKITGTTPAGLQDKYGNQWYRVRSTGHAKLAGLARVSGDILTDPNGRHTNALRKYSLLVDRKTGGTLTTPEATRTVEQILQPKTGMIPALLANTELHIHDKDRVDSFDSTDPTKSSTIGGLAGQYDATKYQSNGTIMTNGSAKDALQVDGSQTLVYGNAGTNGGSFTDPNHEIQGMINNSVSTKINPVPVPSWGLPGYPSINSSVTSAKNNTTITASSNAANNYYKIDQIGKTLTLALPAGVTSATINIWLTDKMTGDVYIPPGVTLNLYFSGKSFKPDDTGFVNANQLAKTLNIYGCDPNTGDLKLDLNLEGAGFYGSIYAPSADLKLHSDKKPGDDFFGSFVADTIDGDAYFHYDESLNGVGEVIDYARASYVEDPR